MVRAGARLAAAVGVAAAAGIAAAWESAVSAAPTAHLATGIWCTPRSLSTRTARPTGASYNRRMVCRKLATCAGVEAVVAVILEAATHAFHAASSTAPSPGTWCRPRSRSKSTASAKSASSSRRRDCMSAVVARPARVEGLTAMATMERAALAKAEARSRTRRPLCCSTRRGLTFCCSERSLGSRCSPTSFARRTQKCFPRCSPPSCAAP